MLRLPSHLFGRDPGSRCGDRLEGFMGERGGFYSVRGHPAFQGADGGRETREELHGLQRVCGKCVVDMEKIPLMGIFPSAKYQVPGDKCLVSTKR